MNDAIVSIAGPAGTIAVVPLVWGEETQGTAFQCDLLVDPRVTIQVRAQGGWELMKHQHSPTHWRVMAADFQAPKRLLDKCGLIIFTLVDDVDDGQPVQVRVAEEGEVTNAKRAQVTNGEIVWDEIRVDDGRFYEAGPSRPA